MYTVKLQKEDLQDISQIFNVGEHILGRGGQLQCTSKKVSRKHGILNITADGNITLKSTHNNPCFYKPSASDNVSVLTFGHTLKINHNDKIALSLDHGWFIVHVKDEHNTLKRKHDTEDVSDSKKTKSAETSSDIPNDIQIKSEPVDQEAINDIQNITEVEIKSEPIIPNINVNSIKIENEPDTFINTENIKIEPQAELTLEANTDSIEVKQEPVCETEIDAANDKTDIKVDKNDIQDEENNENKDDKPSTSGTNKRPWRDRCWYGNACYRKNGTHRVEFKHPGDSDFDSDPDDSRPVCCYGAGCYRKNKEHRKRYRHPGQNKLGTKPPAPPRKRRTVKPKAPPQPMSQDSEEFDDYLAHPFLDDGSEDEYEPSQETDTESEYEDSQEASEDHRRLFREARDFTRSKK